MNERTVSTVVLYPNILQPSSLWQQRDSFLEFHVYISEVQEFVVEFLEIQEWLALLREPYTWLVIEKEMITFVYCIVLFCDAKSWRYLFFSGQ